MRKRIGKVKLKLLRRKKLAEMAFIELKMKWLNWKLSRLNRQITLSESRKFQQEGGKDE